MTSWLHEQRLAAVLDAIRACGARSVLDLGCGDGDLLARLVEEPCIDRLVGLDLSAAALERARTRLGAAPGAARVALVHGSLTAAGPALAGFDCAVLVETIEHIDPAQLSLVERAIFGRLRPGTVVVTTPNAEYNALLGVPSHRYRHPDHRFEWGRAKFRGWAEGAAGRNGYAAACSDIAGRDQVHGGASQMAVFTRGGERDPVLSPSARR